MTHFKVPPKVMAAFAPRQRVPVVVKINGYSWRTTIAPYGGEFYIGLRKEVKAAVGADPGDKVKVEMTLDEAPRTIAAPRDLTRALSKAGLRTVFDKLAYSHRREYVQWIEDAKKAETRERRVAGAVEKIRLLSASRNSSRRAP